MLKNIITIDGPSASGKGTIARRLADKLNYFYLDTGGIYRSLALHLIINEIDPDDADACTAAALKFAKIFKISMVENPAIRTEAVASVTSKSSRHPGVREALLNLQRSLAHFPPQPYVGAVLDGRDTGTVICPDAPIKLFLTAHTMERAARRTKELLSKGELVSYADVLQELEARDLRDANRDTAPLRPAQDAATVDTSDMDADMAFDAVLKLVRARLSEAA